MALDWNLFATIAAAIITARIVFPCRQCIPASITHSDGGSMDNLRADNLQNVALAMARDSLWSAVSENSPVLRDNRVAFSAALENVKLAIPSSERKANAEDASQYIKKALEHLDGIEARYFGGREGKMPRVTADTLEVSRKQLYRAVVDIEVESGLEFSK